MWKVKYTFTMTAFTFDFPCSFDQSNWSNFVHLDGEWWMLWLFWKHIYLINGWAFLLFSKHPMKTSIVKWSYSCCVMEVGYMTYNALILLSAYWAEFLVFGVTMWLENDCEFQMSDQEQHVSHKSALNRRFITCVILFL